MTKDLQKELRLIVAEFLGTAMLASSILIVGNMFGTGTGPWYTALSAGAMLMLIVGVFGRISGAHVNPAVTISLWTLKKIDSVKAMLYIGAQFMGGASALTFYNYVTSERIVSTGAESLEWPIFVAEAVGAAVFGMGIIAVLSQKLDGLHKAFVIGGSFTTGALVSSLASEGFINPAVALGNNVWDKTVVIAPIIGMVIGMNLYWYVFVDAAKGTPKK